MHACKFSFLIFCLPQTLLSMVLFMLLIRGSGNRNCFSPLFNLFQLAFFTTVSLRPLRAAIITSQIRMKGILHEHINGDERRWWNHVYVKKSVLRLSPSRSMQCCVNDIHIHITGKEGRLNSCKSRKVCAWLRCFLGRSSEGRPKAREFQTI